MQIESKTRDENGCLIPKKATFDQDTTLVTQSAKRISF